MVANKSKLYWGILAVSAALIFYLLEGSQDPPTSRPSSNKQHIEAFAIAHNTSTHYYDEQGQLSYTFKSRKLSHYRPNDDSNRNYTEIELPFVVVANDTQPWQLQAQTGQIDADQTITLHNDVELKQEAYNGIISRLTTNKLILDTQNKVAHTQDPVTISSSVGKITAVGMRADLENKKIELLSKVKGRHQPNEFQ